MKKTEYLIKLDHALYKLQEKDRQETLRYYEELIDDHFEECNDEELAVSKLPSIDEVVKATYADLPVSKRMVARFSTGNIGFNICLAILTFPIWLPLGICFFVLIFLSYFFIWLLTILYYVVTASIGISTIASFVAIFISMGAGATQTFVCLAATLVLAGLTILLIVGTKPATKLAMKLTILLSKGIKSIFVKEAK